MILKATTEKQSPAYKYRQWFIKNARSFDQVDRKLSESISKNDHCMIKQCYMNVWRAVLSDTKMDYYEGYVISDGVPVPLEHCWGVKSGLVVDPTLIISVKNLSYDRIGKEYCGIKIPTSYIIKRALKTKRSGPYLFDYWREKHG